MVLSDFKTHALNHNANFLYNESVSLIPRASMNGTVEGKGVFEQILRSWCGYHKPNTKVLRSVLKHVLVSLLEEYAKNSFTFRQKKNMNSVSGKLHITYTFKNR